jgi:hypothetical protein
VLVSRPQPSTLRLVQRAQSSPVRLRSPFGWTLAGTLLAWAAAPLVAMAFYAHAHGGRATGAFSSLLVQDELQYFTWIRQSGDHVAIANLFDTAPQHHVFVLPPFLVSGALWRLGLPLQLAYHLWTAVGALALVAGVLAYARRFLAGTAALCAAVLALAFGTPVLILSIWFELTSSHGGARLLAYVLSPLSALWGYDPRLLAVAAMPPFFLCLEGILVAGRRRLGWEPRRYMWAAALLGAGVSWLHPWQGVIALLVVVGLAAWDRFDLQSVTRLAIPAVGTALTILYYAFLRHHYSEWHRAAHNPSYLIALDIVIVLLPFVALAAVGVRRPGRDVQERVLWLWPVATGISFLAPTGGQFEVVAGLNIPLAILCVRAWQRLRGPRWLAAAALAAAVLGAVVPLVDNGIQLSRDGSGTLWLHNGDRQALRYIADSHAPGSVLADSHIATATVAFTGRRMWAAHANWSPQYIARATLMNEAVAGRLAHHTMQQLLVATRARFLFRDCRRPAAPGLTRSLGSLVASEHRFGCATVLELTTA